MNLILKSAVSAALLTAAAVSAHAQLATTPTAPSTYPANTAISPGQNNTTPGNGGVLVQAFDPLTGKSLTEYLGVNFNAFTPANAVTAAGGSNDFGVIGGSTLWNATFSGDTNPIDFVVVSANSATSGATSILTTLAPGTTPTTNGSIKNSAVANAAGSFAGAVGGLTAGQSSTSGQAAGANPAQTLATTDNGYSAVVDLGPQWGGTFANAAGTAGGGAVDFYQFTTNGTLANKAANFTQYQNANGAATWTLSATGDLVYSVPGSGGGGAPVPLPAAVWLLGSGLLGLAGIGRRRALKV